MLRGRAGSAGGAAGSCKHTLPPKGKKPSAKCGKPLPLPLPQLVKTKSLNSLSAAGLPDALRRAVSRAERDEPPRPASSLPQDEQRRGPAPAGGHRAAAEVSPTSLCAHGVL